MAGSESNRQFSEAADALGDEFRDFSTWLAKNSAAVIDPSNKTQEGGENTSSPVLGVF